MPFLHAASIFSQLPRGRLSLQHVPKHVFCIQAHCTPLHAAGSDSLLAHVRRHTSEIHKASDCTPLRYTTSLSRNAAHIFCLGGHCCLEVGQRLWQSACMTRRYTVWRHVLHTSSQPGRSCPHAQRARLPVRHSHPRCRPKASTVVAAVPSSPISGAPTKTEVTASCAATRAVGTAARLAESMGSASLGTGHLSSTRTGPGWLSRPTFPPKAADAGGRPAPQSLAHHLRPIGCKTSPSRRFRH